MATQSTEAALVDPNQVIPVTDVKDAKSKLAKNGISLEEPIQLHLSDGTTVPYNPNNDTEHADKVVVGVSKSQQVATAEPAAAVDASGIVPTAKAQPGAVPQSPLVVTDQQGPVKLQVPTFPAEAKVQPAGVGQPAGIVPSSFGTPQSKRIAAFLADGAQQPQPTEAPAPTTGIVPTSTTGIVPTSTTGIVPTSTRGAITQKADAIVPELSKPDDVKPDDVKPAVASNATAGAAAPAPGQTATAHPQFQVPDKSDADARAAFKEFVAENYRDHIFQDSKGNYFRYVPNNKGGFDGKGVAIQKGDFVRNGKWISTAKDGSQINGLTREPIQAEGVSYDSLDDGAKSLVDAVGRYQKDMSPRSIGGTPEYRRKILEAVLQKYPDWSQRRYVTMQKADQAFSSGKQGDAVNSLNTVMGHLADMYHKIDGLPTSDGAFHAAVMNPLNVTAAGRGLYGADQQRKLREFNTIKNSVRTELIRALSGGVPTVSASHEWDAEFDAANTPAALKGVIKNAIIPLLKSRNEQLYEQYKGSTGIDKVGSFINKKAADNLMKLGINPGDFDSQLGQATAADRGGDRQAQVTRILPQQAPARERIAVNPKTGEKVVLRNGQWIPLQ